MSASTKNVTKEAEAGPNGRPRPYGSQAFNYIKSGCAGAIPVGTDAKPLDKDPPPPGYTGWKHGDKWPTDDKAAEWTRERGHFNIALRLARDFVSLDVDAYKPGAVDTMKAITAAHGKLPRTWVSSSRSDGSGIRLFRLPFDVTEGVFANTINHPDGTDQTAGEVIHHGHRFAVVWPSIHPDTGNTYQWHHQDTGESRIPLPDEIPELPAEWVDHLRGECSCYDSGYDWTKIRVTSGDPVADCYSRWHSKLVSGTYSRHDAALGGTMPLVAFRYRGWPGADECLAKLESAFLASVTQGDNTRTQGEARAEWQRMVDGAEEKAPSSPIPQWEPQSQKTTSSPPTTRDEEDDFWESRPELSHIRTYAQAQMAAPHAVLAVVLCRVVCQTPAAVVLPATIYDYASLNTTVALVGPSGGGKGGSTSVGAAAVSIGPQTFDTHTLGTGQGIAHGYGHYDGKAKTVMRHADSVLFTVEEVDHLAAHNAQTGSTTLAELRRFGMGEKLGHLYVDPKRRVEIAPHSYRGAFIVAVQPARAGVIIDATDGGTPQRFYWASTIDPHPPKVDPDRPEPWRWTLPPSRDLPTPERGWRPIPVCETAVEAIRQAQRDRRDGRGDPLDGHALLTRERIAAALGILSGRYEVSEEDWQLAGYLMRVSDATRGEVVEALSEKRRLSNRQRGQDEAERSVIVTEAVEDAAIKRVARSLVRHLPDRDSIPRHELRKKLASRDRDYFDSAVDRLLEAGQIEAAETPHGTTYQGAEK